MSPPNNSQNVSPQSGFVGWIAVVVFTVKYAHKNAVVLAVP